MSLLLRLHGAVVPPQQPVATSSYWDPRWLEREKKEIKRAVKLGPADPRPVSRRAPEARRAEWRNKQTLNRIAAADIAAKQARGARLRQIALADDDWLMTT